MKKNKLFYACAAGRDPSALDALTRQRDIRRAVRAWLRTLGCTVAELLDAARYAIEGVGEPDPDPTPMAASRDADRPTGGDTSESMELLHREIASAAALTGLGLDDILVQTPSALVGMIHAAHVEAGEPLTRSAARAHADYLATLAAIRRRLEGQSNQAQSSASAAQSAAVSARTASHSGMDSASIPRLPEPCPENPSETPSKKDLINDNMTDMLNHAGHGGQE